MARAVVEPPRADHLARRIIEHGTRGNETAKCFRCGEQTRWMYRRAKQNKQGKWVGQAFYVCDRHLPDDLRPA